MNPSGEKLHAGKRIAEAIDALIGQQSVGEVWGMTPR
ncbi:MAG: hypothetical protein QOI12_4868 [Alphaproteobacteria bacterium]|jgi:hypothetical protein|nr:hypothetical protein [Alphaproteobacteria bacterium]